MKPNHRFLFLMYLSVGILSMALLPAIPFLDLESSTWLLVMYPLLTVIWFANAFVHWKRMKQNKA